MIVTAMTNQPGSSGTIGKIVPLILALTPFAVMVSACVVTR
jgi:hypothetical protein